MTYCWRTILLCLSAGVAVLPAHAQRTMATNSTSNADGVRAAEAVLARKMSVQLGGVSLSSAVNAVAARAGIRIGYRSVVLDAYKTPVRLRVENASLRHVLDAVLAGTSLSVHTTGLGELVIVDDVADTRGVNAKGIITGRVIDVKTRRPIAGAAITIDQTSSGVSSNENGSFRITAVSAGMHTIRVRRVGYVRFVREVRVIEGETINLEVTLEASANTLDQVVVTGTVIPTELKAVPNAITVITAKEIEERGITQIQQLFRGDIPGLFVPNQGSRNALSGVMMFSRGGTATLNGKSAGVTEIGRSTNPIKTYVDGIELADPQYLSQIDPRTIERIEILTGPQASTIYGSNALNGVMQIFTKRGTESRPQLSMTLLSGVVQNSLSDALTPQHDYNAQLNGVDGRISYNAGAFWNYMGQWSPASKVARVGASGGARLSLPTAAGAVTADVTARRTSAQNKTGGASDQIANEYQATGFYTSWGFVGLAPNQRQLLSEQTVGLSLGFTPFSWWSHEFTGGQDVSTSELRYESPGYSSVSDTALFYYQTQTSRQSLRYTTTLRTPLTSYAQSTMTFGVDGWQTLSSQIASGNTTVLTGSLNGANSLFRDSEHNRGGFFQGQLGIAEKLFFTYGLRAEWNPNFGKNEQPNYAPRYGVAYTQDIGRVTTKFRASYGRSTRPPIADLKNAQKASWAGFSPDVIRDYGDFDWYLPNPDLGPEYQRGGEGGIEAYFGTRASVIVTRYNQTVDHLINGTRVDSVRSLIPNPPSGGRGPDADGYRYQRQWRNLNVASIRNQGWEVQGTMQTGPITTRGTYSFTKSRVIGVDPKYRSVFTNFSELQPGATFQYLPEHTWALGATYTQSRATVSLNANGVGQIWVSGNEFSARNISYRIRLQSDIANTTGSYNSLNSGYVLADFNASYRVSPTAEAVVQVQNITDNYTNDYMFEYAALGRQLKAGVRLRMQ